MRSRGHLKHERESWLRRLNEAQREELWGNHHFIIPLWDFFVQLWISPCERHGVLGHSSTIEIKMMKLLENINYEEKQKKKKMSGII